ncbi:unnamed protein product [Urochloa humidicola]
MSSASPTMPPPPPPCDGTFTMNAGSYSEAKNVETGSYYRSVPVDIGGHSWRIAFYPDGTSPATAGSMSLFLLLDEDVHVKFRFAMHELGGGETIFASGEVAAAFTRRRHAHGIERFVSRDRFEKSALSKNDSCFAIRCDLSVFPAAGSQPAAGPSSGVKAPPPASSTRTAPAAASGGILPADLGRLLATKEGSDVEIEVSGKVFAAHKTVLAARSPVFKEDFFGPAKEKDTDFVRISNMCPEAFEALLHYMYTDTLPEKMTKTKLLLVLELLIAADRYGMKGLKSLAEDKLCGHVRVSTVLVVLEFATKHRSCKVKKKCLEFIGSGANARAVLAGNDFEDLARFCPSAVKDVITEILDTREARSRRLVIVCLYALFFLILPFLLFAVFKKQ